MRALVLVLLVGGSEAGPSLSDSLFVGSGLLPWAGIVVAVAVLTVMLAELGRPGERKA
jgi:hypothetical protein